MRSHFIADSLINVKIAIVLAVLATGCLMNSCDECECPSAPECAPVPASDCSGQIQLSQLDAGSRARLKQELEAEIKDELRTELTRELEAQAREKDLADRLTNADRQNNDADVAKPLPDVVAPDIPIEQRLENIKPDPLPPTQKIERDAGGMGITRHVFTTRVERRLPVSDRESFAISDGAVFCYVEISSPEDRDREVTIRFTHSTGLAQSYTLPVSQSPAWRTWAKLNLTRSMTGTWLCEIFNEDHVLLSSRPFIVVDKF